MATCWRARHLDILASVIDPTGAHADDPLCWPLKASSDDLAGLPPHLLSINELDFHRDEGIAYPASSSRRVLNSQLRLQRGLCHGADLLSPTKMPEEYDASVSVLADPAARVAPAPKN